MLLSVRVSIDIVIFWKLLLFPFDMKASNFTSNHCRRHTTSMTKRSTGKMSRNLQNFLNKSRVYFGVVSRQHKNMKKKSTIKIFWCITFDRRDEIDNIFYGILEMILDDFCISQKYNLNIDIRRRDKTLRVWIICHAWDHGINQATNLSWHCSKMSKMST